MIRIWLGPDDVARTRLVSGALPLHEVFLSLAGRRAAHTGPEPARELRDLADGGAFPDFLAPLPPAGASELDEALSRVRETGLDRVRRDLLAFTGGTLNAWHHSLAAGDRHAHRRLADAVRRHHERHVAALTEAGEPVIRHDVRAKATRLAAGGVEALFAAIDPTVRWHNPVLVVDSRRDLDVRPNGAGVTLVPSPSADRIWVGTDPDAVFLAYPVPMPGRRGPSRAIVGTDRAEDPLVALLGRSRAAVLRAAADEAGNTTDLARRVGISAPSASQHLSVLRAAGLLATTRRGNVAHHAPTSLAYTLLAASPALW